MDRATNFISKQLNFLSLSFNPAKNLAPQLKRWLMIMSSILVGAGLGLFINFTSGLPSSWETLLLMMIPGFTGLMFLINLGGEKLVPRKIILVTIIVGIVLNLDVTVILNRYPERLMSFDSWRASMVTAALMFGYALWLIDETHEESSPAKTHLFPTIMAPLIGLFIASMISIIQAVDTTATVIWLIFLVELILTTFYVANQIRSKEDLNLVLLVLLSSFILESLLMALQYFTGFEFSLGGISGSTYGGEAGSRVTGTLGGANDAGQYASTNLVLAFGILLSTTKSLEKYMAGSAVLLGAIALVATFSRSSWRGFLIALTIFLIIGVLKEHIKVETVALLFFGFCILVLSFYGPIMDRLNSDDNSAKSRPVMAELAGGVIAAKPIWGVGANNYSLVAEDYPPPSFNTYPYPSVEKVGNHPVHNRYLLVWAEMGIPGIVFWILSILAAAFLGIKVALTSPDKRLALIALALVGALISYSAHLLTDHLVNRSLTRWIWIIFAMLAAINVMASHQHTDQISDPK